MKISFDIDGVLDTDKGKRLARRLISQGNDVYIITARNKRFNREVEVIAEQLGIRKNRIYYTEGADKWRLIELLDIDRHYDDNEEQIDKIGINSSARGILFKDIE